MRRVGWVFYTLGLVVDPIANLALMRKEDKGVKLIICKLSVTLNLMGKTQTSIGCLENDFRTWAEV